MIMKVIIIMKWNENERNEIMKIIIMCNVK